MAKDYLKLLLSRQLTPATKAPDDHIFITIQGHTIASAGNVISLVGLPKAGKSTFTGAIIASSLSGKPVFDFNVKMNTKANKNRIALFDTEQGYSDVQRQLNYIKPHTPYKEDIINYFDIFLCNSDEGSDILGMIQAYLKVEDQAGIIIIDGILDILDAFNDEVASKKLIRQLKKWAKDYGIVIIIILHLGKKDLNSIGHLGSAADRASQSVIEIEKTKEGFLLAKAKFLRSAPGFSPIQLYYNHNLGSYSQNF